VYAAVVHRRRVLWMMLGAAVPALLLGLYHKACFGSPFKFPYGYIQDQKFAKYHKTGFYGFGLPDPEAIFIGLFSNSFGLFAFSPFLAAGVAGGALAWKRGVRREGVLTLVVFVAMILFLAGMTYWRGGWSVGPRFVMVLAPFLAAGAADFLRHVSRRKRAIAGGLVGASIFMCGIAGAIYPHFPESYDNPIFDIALPLIYEGRAPYNVGWLLGIKGPWGLIPLLVIVLAFLVWSVARGADEVEGPTAPRRLRAAHVGLAALVAVAFITWCSLFARDLDPDERHAGDVVRRNFEPK